MPSLIRELAVSGSRKSDGTANDSGKVFLYEPGTTTIVPGYQDDSLNEAWTTVDGGIPLDAGGRVKIWINDPVDVVIEDADGGTIDTMLGYNKTRAEQIEIENESYTGDITDESGAVSEGLGGKTDLDTVLTTLAGSFGPNGQFKEASGATARDYDDVVREIRISVKDYGAVGNGVADDSVAIQQAISRAKALGGAIVYFPPGTYKVSTNISLSGATGVSFQGAGVKATIIVTSSTTSNVFELTSCTGFFIEGIKISAIANNASSALLFTTCTYVTMRSVLVNADSGGSFLIPVIFTSTSESIRLDDCDLYPKQADSLARTIRFQDTGNVVVTGGFLRDNEGAAVEIRGSTSKLTMVGVRFASGASGNPTGVLWVAGATGQDFNFIGCLSLRMGLGLYSKAFDLSALSTDPRLRQYACGQDGLAEDVTSGGTVTPNRGYGTDFRYRGTTTGAAYIVAAPTPTPVAGLTSGQRDTLLRLTFHNNAGGAVTGWTLNAVYHTAGAVSNIDGSITVITFQWDATSSVWREIARANTT